jgi:hypothetical protein
MGVVGVCTVATIIDRAASKLIAFLLPLLRRKR